MKLWQTYRVPKMLLQRIGCWPAWILWTIFLIGTGCSPSPGGEGGSDGGGGNGFSPDSTPTGWPGGSAGKPNPGGKCPDGKNGTPMRLPETQVEYCVKAHPSCETPAGDCPLYITMNTQGAFFSRVGDDPQGRIITVELYSEFDGNDVKDKLAELPRVIAQDYPGLDRERIYGIGWSAGAGGLSRGLCHNAKKSDFSDIGTTSDLYAAIVSLGGCSCTNDYKPLKGKWHVLTWNGMDDQFNDGDACEAGLRERALVNGCHNPSGIGWEPVHPEDPFAKNADGSRNAERLVFADCQNGDVVGYRFRGEGHVLSAKKNFDPKISGYDTAWRFLLGRKKH